MILNTTPSKLHIPKIGGSRSSSQGLCLTTILNSAIEYISYAMWDMSISKIILFKTWICELSLIGRVLPKFYTGKQWNNSLMHDNKKSQNLLFSHTVISESLQPHRLQHARPLCSSPSLGSCSSSCPLSRWCHQIISSSVIPFYSCFQSFPASGSFLMSQLFALGGQSIEASASASVLPMSIQDWFPLGLTGLASFQFKGLSREPSPTLQFKNIFSLEFNLFMVQLSHSYMTTGKTIALTSVGKVMCLLFNMLSRFVTAFLPRSKHLFISWLQSPSAVILEPPQNSLSLFSLFPHLFAMKWWNWMPWCLLCEYWF